MFIFVLMHAAAASRGLLTVKHRRGLLIELEVPLHHVGPADAHLPGPRKREDECEEFSNRGEESGRPQSQGKCDQTA